MKFACRERNRAKMEFQHRREEVTFVGENFFTREERKIKTRLSKDKNLASLDN
jgi:hypothetical protein